MLKEETEHLASYSTYKALYDDYKNVNQVVAAFIDDAVVHDNTIYTLKYRHYSKIGGQCNG